MLGLTLDTGLATVLGFWKNFTYFLRRRGLGFWRFFSCRKEKYAQWMLRFDPLHAQFALGVQTLFLRVYEFDLCDDVGHFSCSVRIFRTPPSGVESPVFLPINSQGLWTYAFRLKDRVNNNNNNNNNNKVQTGVAFCFFCCGPYVCTFSGHHDEW